MNFIVNIFQLLFFFQILKLSNLIYDNAWLIPKKDYYKNKTFIDHFHISFDLTYLNNKCNEF